MKKPESGVSQEIFEFGERVQREIRVLRLKQVIEALGVGRSTIYDRMNPSSPRYDPTFPRPIRLSGGSQGRGAIGWINSEICIWINSRVSASRH
ncbi:AlpA family phage regulatory protein [Pseudomonas sp. L-22-4S-12]|uniref:helix-turn-helix transcriptional regulator n=1 Tax=Pseudomonas sp. L-22-4S-12 TaxID=2610893 RepID=UPI001325F4BE|nr:AlpA family phage regulatory protein [Pseudomonas sp. L-22-4S-12]MWV18280.1 AlpA family phage regulatory protein [Pseudomonas sp. L-22-4S-12]